MARQLTIPKVNPDTVFQRINKITLHFPPKFENGEPVFDPDQTYVEFTVVDYDDTPKKLYLQVGNGAFANWPTVFRDDVRSIYAKLEAYAESLGLMNPGTSEPVP